MGFRSATTTTKYAYLLVAPSPKMRDGGCNLPKDKG